MSQALVRLRQVAESLPPDASVTVPCTWLLEALQEFEIQRSDLTVAQVSERFQRSPSCIRSWIAQGILRAYKLRGRQLRVTPAALEEFEANERAGTQPPSGARRPVADLSAWRRERPA